MSSASVNGHADNQISDNGRKGYMEDQVLGDEPPTAIEQLHVDNAIAASLVPEKSNPYDQSFGTSLAHAQTDSSVPFGTQDSTLRATERDTEDRDLQVALLHDSAKQPQQSQAKDSSPRKTPNLVGLPLLNATNADTLVFIDPPPRQPSRNDYMYDGYASRYSPPHRMRRENFLALNSPYFEAAFGPTNQHRVLRRRHLANKLPAGIKYVLDLTPPIEGEDAVYLMTELCCSLGVRRWFESAERWGVAKRLVGGQDESEAELSSEITEDDATGLSGHEKSVATRVVEDNNGPESSSGQAATTGDGRTLNTNKAEGGQGSPSVPTPSRKPIVSIIPEYTAIRHRSAIERVLHAAVEGLDPSIDSAPKLWTTFAVSKFFEITHSPLTDYIISWLRATPNTYFVEVLPEISQKIAEGLQCEDLSRDTFAILVGEEALANVWTAREEFRKGPEEAPRRERLAFSVHGRRREDLHEDYQTRIEYASKSFTERITSRFNELVDERMSWLDRVPEYFALSSQHDESGGETVTDLKSLLKAYVRGRIYWVLCRNYLGLVGPISDMKCIGSDLFPTVSFTETYNGLRPRERIFTRSFWKSIQREEFSRGTVNTYSNEYSPLAPIGGWTSAALEMQAANLFEEVSMSRLLDMVEKFNDRCGQGNHLKDPTISHAILPYRPARPVGAEITAQPLGDLSIGGPCSDRTGDDIPNEKYDGKRRRLSELPEDFSKNQNPKSSKQLPIRSSIMTPFSQEISRIRKRMVSFENRSERASPHMLDSSGAKGTVSKISSTPKSPRSSFEPELIPISASARSVKSQGVQAIKSPDDAMSAIDSSASPTVDNDHIHGSGKTNKWDWLSSPLRSVWAAEGVSSNGGPVSEKTLLESNTPRFDIRSFLSHVSREIRCICAEILAPPDFSTRSDSLDLTLTDTLVCLEGSEWKYLPLWAGGNDDGSGGVFDDCVPLAETGVSANVPGPGFHTGLSSAGSSEYELIGTTQDGSSSFHTSTVVNDGFSDQIDRRRVYDADSLWGDVMAKKDQGIGSTSEHSQDKKKPEYANSDWSEVTVGKGIHGVASDRQSIREADSLEIAQHPDDELLDDIWDDDEDEDDEEAFESTADSDSDLDMVKI